MIEPLRPSPHPVTPTSPSGPTPRGLRSREAEASESGEGPGNGQVGLEAQDPPVGKAVLEPILCRHCGRTASNGISCEGSCVADSGY